MERQLYEFVTGPTRSQFPDVLSALTEMSAYVGMILQSGISMSKESNDLLAEIEPDLYSIADVSAYPGTEILDGSEPRHLYRSSPEVARTLAQYGNRFWDWQNPKLPEDLHFLRADGSAVFGSIASEYECWLELSEDEVLEWLSRFHFPLRPVPSFT